LEIVALLFASCATKAPPPAQASAPPPQAAPAQPANPTPAKVAKQRTVERKVPVLVKESSFYPDGLADEYIVYKLDDAKKNVIEKDVYDASRPDPIQRVVSDFKDGRLASESVFESDGSLRSRRDLAYDTSGLPAQETIFDAKGKPQSSSAYSYDASGRKAEWKALDASGSVKAVSDYAYGSSGLVGVEMKDSGGKPAGRIELEYADGKLAKRSYFGADGSLQKFESYAYSDGLLATVEYRGADGSLVSKTSYSYGPSGELVKAAESGPSGAPGEYTTYEYAVRVDDSVETYYE
jgi:antitoxin component YwqK of YwqJK toxin-antitoxin module